MSPNTALSKEKRKKISTMLNDGAFIREIAKELEITPNTVRKYKDGE